MRGIVAKRIRKAAELIGPAPKRTVRQTYRRLKKAYVKGTLSE